VPRYTSARSGVAGVVIMTLDRLLVKKGYEVVAAGVNL